MIEAVTASEFIRVAREQGASDVHASAYTAPTMRVRGRLVRMADYALSPEETESLIRELVESAALSERYQVYRLTTAEVDRVLDLPEVGRVRMHLFHSRGAPALSLRLIPAQVPDLLEVGAPDVIRELARHRHGLVLVTGPTGHGKTTTIAAFLRRILELRADRVVTIEDPIEYLLPHGKGVAVQRELGGDTVSYAAALRAALREDPDVIMVGEIRDRDTASAALEAAETGHLVISSMHTIDTVGAVDRILEMFHVENRAYSRAQLADALLAVITQRLLPASDSAPTQIARRKELAGRVPAWEVLLGNRAGAVVVRQHIRSDNVAGIRQLLEQQKEGMQTLEQSLLELVRSGLVSRQAALENAAAPKALEVMLGGGV
jgi:twitching motility protein PilT